ncbi:hypothetical protein G3M48_009158 [Beauveria asiatica]|uniref:Uncharacterized protein n=1 Tax=Beauveria asiatica TaxID=1069075 RepID=A0AAW0RJQ1_9HYPO
MKFSTISSFLSVAGIAAVTATDAVSSQTCVPYDGICYQNGVNVGACCGNGICAGSRCRNPSTETGAPTTATSTASPQSTCVPYDGICYLNGVDHGACCGDGICAGSRCRNPKTETGAPTTATTSTSTAQPTCVPYDGICYQNGQNVGACCGDGICAGSRCRNPKTETGKPATTPGQTTGGAVVTQISDGQIQAPTGAPTVPVVAGAAKAIPGLAAAGAAVAFLL